MRCSPATLAPRTVPRGTSLCPPAEVGDQTGPYKWVAIRRECQSFQWDLVSSGEAAPATPAKHGVLTLGSPCLGVTEGPQVVKGLLNLT